MKNFLSALIIITLSLTLFTGCSKKENSGTTKEAKKKTYEYNYAVFFPATHLQAKTAEAWAKEIEKRTEGQIKITMFFGGTLSNATQTYEAVESGIADMGMSAFAYTRGRFPLLEGLDLPVGYPDGKTATKAANEMVKKYQPEELSGVHVLYIHAHGPGILASKKEIHKASDLEGLQIRGTGLSAKIVEALGANPISMSQGDTYEALQKGVVDATFCPVETLKGWKQGEAIDYVIDTRSIGYTTTMFAVMNKDKWNALPENLQNVISEVSDEWIEKQGKAWDQADDEGRAFVSDLGKTFIDLSDAENEAFVKAMQPIFASYIAETEKQGLPGKAFISDLQSMLK
ncbi:MAG: TRAP transporter substrate-binding protein [Spirochaetales bacterium]|nr:TRAP transporter substrate-binding protein [Spirochaetales bacterium]